MLLLWLSLLLAQAQDAPAQDPPPEKDQVTPPTLLSSPMPMHPLGPEGDPRDVPVIIEIDEHGHVVRVQFPADTPEIYKEPARAAIEASIFAPATRNGEPVPYTASLAVHFEPTQTDIPESAHVMTIEDTRTKEPQRGVSDVHIDVRETQAVPSQQASDALQLAPGVFLTRQGSDGHPVQIFLRGFDARHGQDVQISVDGMPLNQVGNPHGHGLVDTNIIPAEALAGMRAQI